MHLKLEVQLGGTWERKVSRMLALVGVRTLLQRRHAKKTQRVAIPATSATAKIMSTDVNDLRSF